jgi:hypothetical protein
VRYQPVAIASFGIGLVLLAVAGVLTAVAIRRSGVLPAAAGVVFAAGLVLFLPQFFLPAAARIAHGVVVLAGCGWLALAMWRASSVKATASQRSRWESGAVPQL